MVNAAMVQSRIHYKVVIYTTSYKRTMPESGDMKERGINPILRFQILSQATYHCPYGDCFPLAAGVVLSALLKIRINLSTLRY